MHDSMHGGAIAEAGRVPSANIFFLGCFESRVTVLSQQRRALNLVDAILGTGVIRRAGGRVAVVGAGAAGLTAAAALAAAAPQIRVVLYERRDKLMYLQQGSDRDLHPHLYDWPAEGSTERDAGLQILNWQADTAGEVANKIVKQFEELQSRASNLEVKTGRFVKDIQIRGGLHCSLEIEGAPAEGGLFDAAIVAIGFGYEREVTGENQSYWTPSRVVGPLPPGPRSLFISGNGDGGLVDFAMAAFNRLQHREIVKFVVDYEGLDRTKEALLDIERQAWTADQDSFDIFGEYERTFVASHERPSQFLPPHLLIDVSDRLRKDAQIWLHTREPKLFRRNTALINRFTAFLAIMADKLYRSENQLIVVRTGAALQTLPDNPRMIDVGGERVEPLYRFFRFGPASDENLKPFQQLVAAYRRARSSRPTSFRPATPPLTASACERFRSLNTKPEPVEASAPGKQQGRDAAADAREELSNRGISLGPDSLKLHIRSGNADVVALMLRSGLPPDTLLGDKTPLDLALEQIEIRNDDRWDSVEPARYEVVEAIFRARPLDVSRVAHRQLSQPAPARLVAMLRAGTPIDCRDDSGQSLAVRAMRMDDSATGTEWTGLLVKEASPAPVPLAHWILLWATARGRTAVVRRLLEQGVLVDAQLHGSLPLENIEESERAFWWPGGTGLHQVLAQAERPYSFMYGESSRYDEGVLRLLLERGASPNTVNAAGRMPLHIAADEDLVHAARLLLDRGAVPSAQDGGGHNVVRCAIRHSSELARLLIERWLPDDPAERADLLAVALDRREVSLVRQLLNRGCDPNLPSDKSPSPLFQLAYSWNTASRQADSVACLDLLLQHGTEASSRDSEGTTALHWIAGYSQMVTEAVDLLLTAGAELEARDQQGRTPLMNCSTAAAAQRLLSANASPTMTDSLGYDALDHAHMGRADEVYILLAGDGRAPRPQARLIRAVRDRDAASVVAFLAEGVSPRTPAPYGNSALHVAAGMQFADIVALLLDHGADIDARDIEGGTPLQECLCRDISNRCPNIFADHEACLTQLLERGASTDDVDGHGNAAIFYGFMWWKFPALSTRLLDRCRTARKTDGYTALMVAVERGGLDHVRKLLQDGVDINAKDVDGRTALHSAARWSAGFSEKKQWVEKAQLLISAGADIEAVNDSGETPVFEAMAANNRRMVELFVQSGTNLSHRNARAETLASVALRRADVAMFNWLRTLPHSSASTAGRY